MDFKSFKIQFVIRIIILIIFLSALVYSAIILNSFMRSLFSFFGVLISATELYQFYNRINKEFVSFMESLIYEDFSNFRTSSKKNNTYLQVLYNKLNTKYKNIALARELQNSLMHSIIEHISIGILVVGENGQVVLSNNKLLELFHLSRIKTIKDISPRLINLDKLIDNSNLNKPILTEVEVKGILLKLSIKSTQFKLQGSLYRLISFQDINIELDEQEVISWQKIIRVLTHEIMNSVTPISSLASSLNVLLKKSVSENQISEKHLSYLREGMEAVQERSEGLLHFTESYKKLTQLRYPEFERIAVKELFDDILVLFKNEIDKLNLKLKLEIDESVNMLGDKHMLEQMMINLIKNSMEALQSTADPMIVLKSFYQDERAVIQIIDNGPGIAKDKMDKVFIPFYTTKEGGSGIGLSIARQVMQLHKGNIILDSQPGKTMFILKF